MATTFKKGQEVQLRTVLPKGPVKDMRFDAEGEVEYLVEWQGADGGMLERWFPEAVLDAV
jgi:hypothetical protein